MPFKWEAMTDYLGRECCLFKCKGITCVAKWFENGLSIWYYWKYKHDNEEHTIGKELCGINKKQTQKEYAQYIAKYYNPKTKKFLSHFCADEETWIPVERALWDESAVQTHYELYKADQYAFIKKLKEKIQRKTKFFPLEHIIFDYVGECITKVMYTWLKEIADSIDDIDPLILENNDTEWVIEYIGEKYGCADNSNNDTEHCGTYRNKKHKS